MPPPHSHPLLLVPSLLSPSHNNSVLQEDGSDQSDNDDSIPRSHGKQTLDDDEFYSTTPIRVPSAPGRLASSPYTTPTHMASPRMDSSSPASAYAAPTTPAHMASPRMDYLSPASAHSPPKSPYVAPSPSAQASTLSRSVSSPNPATATPKRVVPADDFDLRFAGAGHARTDSVSDETALGGDFARNERFDAKSEEVEDAAEHDEVLKQKGKGLFSFGSNKPKVHPLSLPLSFSLPPLVPLPFQILILLYRNSSEEYGCWMPFLYLL